MGDAAARLVLGTAQLGMEYGIANRTGRSDRDAADALLLDAWNEGVNMLDTAQTYGDSEAVIGDFLCRHPEARFRVVSKLSPSFAAADCEVLANAVRDSRRRLEGHLSIMLLHDPAIIDLWDDGLGGALDYCIDSGWIDAVGVSVNTPEEFAGALELAGVQVIQAPFNVFDRALLDNGSLKRARALGKQVHLRSVFLQGLLLMEEDELPPGMAFARTPLREWRSFCTRWERTPAEIALLFAAAAAPDARLVVGADSAEQFVANAATLRGPPLDRECMEVLLGAAPMEEKLVRPYLWN
jgi:aryl-alcohol dehydrogenase-like predicted oxidoreductase